MTEDEARNKWCPFARADDMAAPTLGNRPDGSVNCIASECMAFRWQPPQVIISYGSERDTERTYYESMPKDWADCRLVDARKGPDGIWNYTLERRAGDDKEDMSWMEGHCGLAGRPD